MDARNETRFQDGHNEDDRKPEEIEAKRGWLSWLVSSYHFTSLTRRIAVLNLVALVDLIESSPKIFILHRLFRPCSPAVCSP